MRMKHRYIWKSYYNKTKEDGNADISNFKKLFKDIPRVKAYKEKSQYPNKIATIITSVSKSDMKKALSILKENNYFIDINFELENIDKIK